MGKKDVSSNLKKLVTAFFIEFALTILAGFMNYFTGTAQTVVAVSALVLCIACVVLYIASLAFLKQLNKNFKFAFWWIFITFGLYIIQYVFSAIGLGTGNDIFTKISDYVSIVVSISDIVFIVAIIDGTKGLLQERGEEKLVKFGSKLEVVFILSLFASAIVKLVIALLSAVAVVAVVVGTILMIVFLLLYIVAYISFLPFLIKSARRLGR